MKVKYAHFQWVASSWVTSLVLITPPLLSMKQQNYSISSLDIQLHLKLLLKTLMSIML